jgi:hypothetical protein
MQKWYQRLEFKWCLQCHRQVKEGKMVLGGVHEKNNFSNPDDDYFGMWVQKQSAL